MAAFFLAVLLAAIAVVVGTLGYRWLPVGGDAGLGVLFVAVVMALLATAVIAWRERRRGRPVLQSALRAAGTGILTFVLALIPVVVFVVYCFSSLVNPDAPCIR